MNMREEWVTHLIRWQHYNTDMDVQRTYQLVTKRRRPCRILCSIHQTKIINSTKLSEPINTESWPMQKVLNKGHQMCLTHPCNAIISGRKTFYSKHFSILLFSPLEKTKKKIYYLESFLQLKNRFNTSTIPFLPGLMLIPKTRTFERK